MKERAKTKPAYGHLPTGLQGLDGALWGGIPFGIVTEVVGPAGIGKTQVWVKLLSVAVCKLSLSWGLVNITMTESLCCFWKWNRSSVLASYYPVTVLTGFWWAYFMSCFLISCSYVWCCQPWQVCLKLLVGSTVVWSTLTQSTNSLQAGKLECKFLVFVSTGCLHDVCFLFLDQLTDD